MGLWAAIKRSWPDWMGRDPAFRPILDLDDRGSTAGVSVNLSTALTYSAVWAAVNIISRAIGSLPLVPYRSNADGSRERLESNAPLFWVLHEQPNADMTPFVFFETLMHHVLFTGNAYAEIIKDGSSKLTALQLTEPGDMVPYFEGRQLRYKYKGVRIMEPSQLLHVPGLSWDGVRGYSPITKARESFSLGIATERFGASYFGNGAHLGLLLEHPGQLSPEAQERLKASWDSMHKGPDRAHRTAILEEGMKVHTIGVSPEDSQFLETRQFQVEEVARWFNLPLHKLQAKAGERPGGNIEAQRIEFVVDCLRPWCIKIEQECNRKLIPERDRPDTYVEFNVEALLRGDSEARARTYKTYIDMGVMSPAFVATKENLPKPPKPEPVPAPEPPEEMDLMGQAQKDAMRAVVLDAVGRVIRVESNAVRRTAAQGFEKFSQWRTKFYQDEYRLLVQGTLEPVVRLAAPTSDWKERTRKLADDLAAKSDSELKRHGRDTASVEQIVGRWEIERPVELAAEILGGY